MAHLLRPLIDQEFPVVFYDLTTIRSEGLSQLDGDVRHFGMSKDGMVARQFMLGVVQTADGMPICHEVFDGNTAEAATMPPTVRKVLARFPHIRRLVMVADRGLLSIDNLRELSGITWPSGQPLEYILAVPGRRCGEFTEVLQGPHATAAAQDAQAVAEARWQEHRLVVAHDPVRAQEQTAGRASRMAALQARVRSGRQARRAGGRRRSSRPQAQ